jgi:hypothetical protein
MRLARNMTLSHGGPSAVSRNYPRPKAERFANAETGTGFTLTREAVRDSSTIFALLTSLRMTAGPVVIEVICRTPH